MFRLEEFVWDPFGVNGIFNSSLESQSHSQIGYLTALDLKSLQRFCPLSSITLLGLLGLCSLIA